MKNTLKTFTEHEMKVIEIILTLIGNENDPGRTDLSSGILANTATLAAYRGFSGDKLNIVLDIISNNDRKTCEKILKQNKTRICINKLLTKFGAGVIVSASSIYAYKRFMD